MFKNKIIKLFLIFCVILFSIFAFSGCSNEDTSSVNATYIEMNYQGDVVDGQFNIVNNHLDLVALLDDVVPKKYDDSFFVTKSLLVINVVEANRNNKSEIETYTISDKTLNVYIETKQFGNDCVTACWWYILELSEDEIENIESIKIFKNDEEIMNENKQIIMDYIEYAHSLGEDNLSMDNVKILQNYGAYDGVFIVRMNRSAFQVITCVSFLDIGVKMYFEDSNTPLVYKNGDFYELKDSYSNSIITKDNLQALQAKIDNNIILNYFDLADEKIIWNGDINDPYILDDSIIVTLKRTETYPRLDLSVFSLDNAVSMEYLGSITMPNNISNPDKWRQKVIIHLTSEGKEKLVETIRQIEQLEFVKQVNPNGMVEGA